MEVRLLLLSFLFLLLAGCGGGGDSTPATAPLALSPGRTVTVYMCDMAGAPADQFAAEVAYANDQFVNNVSPLYNVHASVVQTGSVDPNLPTVVLLAQPAQLVNTTGGQVLANSFGPDGNLGTVCYNAGTIQDGSWPERLDHVGENMLDRVLLIGERWEAHAYNPADYSETVMTVGPLKGLYALCDFAIPAGALDAFGLPSNNWIGAQ